MVLQWWPHFFEDVWCGGIMHVLYAVGIKAKTFLIIPWARIFLGFWIYVSIFETFSLFKEETLPPVQKLVKHAKAQELSHRPRQKAERQNGVITHNSYRVVLNNILGCELWHHNILGFGCNLRAGMLTPYKGENLVWTQVQPYSGSYSSIVAKGGFLRSWCMSQGRDGWNYFGWIKIKFQLHHEQLNLIKSISFFFKISVN